MILLVIFFLIFNWINIMYVFIYINFLCVYVWEYAVAAPCWCMYLFCIFFHFTFFVLYFSSLHAYHHFVCDCHSHAVFLNKLVNGSLWDSCMQGYHVNSRCNWKYKTLKKNVSWLTCKCIQQKQYEQIQNIRTLYISA